MNIGFDAKRFFHNQTGLGNYSRDLVNAVATFFPEHHYLLFDKKGGHELNSPLELVLPSSGKNLFLWRAKQILNEKAFHKLDVYHGLSNELPFGNYPSHVNKIVTIHDVIFKSHPQNYSFIDRSIYHIKTKHAASVADTVIATSKFTAQQIQLYYPVESSKIKVVYQACNEIFNQAVSSSRVQAFKEKYKLDNPFFLYVSSFNQRKNHLFLLKAFKKYPNPNHHLVLAGSLGDSFEAVNQLIADLDLSKRVTILPNVDQQELTDLYHAASWFVYPSIQEGFGIPLLEAMTCHLPILASNIPVFKEIASNEVLFFDLQKEEELLNQLITLSEIDKIDYSSHIQQYSKESIAKQLMTIYQG